MFFTVTQKIYLVQKIELNCEYFRTIIFYNFRRDLSQQQYIDELVSTFCYEAPSKTTAYRWYTVFNRGRCSLTDEFRKGRPKSVVVLENIDAVHEMILQDRRVIHHEIEAFSGIRGKIRQVMGYQYTGAQIFNFLPRTLILN